MWNARQVNVGILYNPRPLLPNVQVKDYIEHFLLVNRLTIGRSLYIWFLFNEIGRWKKTVGSTVLIAFCDLVFILNSYN